MLLKTLTLINYKNFENKSFDFVSVIILLVFTYSTVGGFIMGSATIGTFYALVLGLNYGTIRFPVDRFI